MIKNSNKIRTHIKKVLAASVVALTVSSLGTLLVYYGIIPQNVFTGGLEGFSNFREMLFYWLFIFVSFSVVLTFVFLFYEEVDFICPNCKDVKTIYNKRDFVVCRKCMESMVPLKGYYDKDKKGGSVL